MKCIVCGNDSLVDEQLDLADQIKSAKCVMEYDNECTVENFDTVKFGKYPQDSTDENDKQNIEWIVLDKQDGRALLLSKYILDCKNYHNEYEFTTWENCDLRKWLNKDFINYTFNNFEQDKIMETLVKNRYMPWLVDYFNGKTEENTNDKIFCLSIDEIDQYFKIYNIKDESTGDIINYHCATKGTKYAQRGENIYDRLRVEEEDCKWWNGNSRFWLRSNGVYESGITRVVTIKADGYLDLRGNDVVNHQHGGVRPALWVKY